ncbi:hypothetical protein WJX74_007976 [Apatococcus lobatus]|uniref:Nucleotide-diphospho-sugar transferase domain-containing protein n=1 Tax=Apatococcus lobatus TaxID=904363 RepID=A0AAW1RMA3_9CHLO
MAEAGKTDLMRVASPSCLGLRSDAAKVASSLRFANSHAARARATSGLSQAHTRSPRASFAEAPRAHHVHHSLLARWTWAATGSKPPAATQYVAHAPPVSLASSPDKIQAPQLSSLPASGAAKDSHTVVSDTDDSSTAPQAGTGWARNSSAGSDDTEHPSSAPQVSPENQQADSRAKQLFSKENPAQFLPGEETLRNPLCLTESNYQQVADTIAGDARAIILTTLDLTFQGKDHSREQLDHMKNFAYHLDRVDRLQNTMTVSYTEETCRLLLSVSIPCFVDRLSPQPDTFPERLQGETAVFAKYWHALSLLKLGINVYFSDSDAAILQDPFVFQDRSFDIEGLSDWNDRSIVPDPRGMFEHPCVIYNTKKDRQVLGGQFIEGYWQHPLSKPDVQKHMNPCQSTGGWFAQPTPPSILFLEHMLHWMTEWHPKQWDQAAWNELIMPHLFGTGSRPPLAYRLLPMESFSNFKVNALRTKQGLPINQVVLHAGEAHGKRKVDEFKKRGLWKASEWQSQTGFDVQVHQQQAVQHSPTPWRNSIVFCLIEMIRNTVKAQILSGSCFGTRVNAKHAYTLDISSRIA